MPIALAVRVAHHHLGLVVAALQLEVARDREPDPVEALARRRLQLHADALVVAEELAARAVGHHQQELQVGEVAALLLLELQRADVDLGRHQHRGLAERLLVADVGRHPQRDAVERPRRVERTLQLRVDALLRREGGLARVARREVALARAHLAALAGSRA